MDFMDIPPEVTSIWSEANAYEDSNYSSWESQFENIGIESFNEAATYTSNSEDEEHPELPEEQVDVEVEVGAVCNPSIEERVEIDRVRVAKALGLAVENVYLDSSSFDRQMSLADKKYVLVDLSGTLHVEDTATPGAVHALECLRTAGFKVLFVTNTTKESRAKLHAKLTNIGFQIDYREIFTSINATKQYIVKKGLRPFLMVAEEAKEDFEGISQEDPNAVVVGLSVNDFNRKTLTDAARLLERPDVELIAIHKGRYFKEKSGLSLGPGPFVVALEFATGKNALVLGKPDTDFYKQALEFIGCDDPAEAVMIGDDVRDDVFGSMKAGLTGILCKTGKYSSSDLQKIHPHIPDFVVENFSQAVQLILSNVIGKMEMTQSQSPSVLAVRIAARKGLFGSYNPDDAVNPSD